MNAIDNNIIMEKQVKMYSYLFIAISLIFLILSFLWPYLSTDRINLESIMPIFLAVFYLGSVIIFLIGITLYKITIWLKIRLNHKGIVFIHSFRNILFTVIAGDAFILRVYGATILEIIFFFILAAIGIWYIFPTSRHITKLKNMIDT